MGMKTSGMKDLISSMDDMSKRTGRAVLTRALKKAAVPMKNKMVALAPFNDGEYETTFDIQEPTKASIRAYHASKKDFHNSAEIIVGSSSRIAWLVEHGGKQERHHKDGSSTGWMPAQPHIRPAFEQHKASFLEDLEKFLAEEIMKTRSRISKRKGK